MNLHKLALETASKVCDLQLAPTTINPSYEMVAVIEESYRQLQAHAAAETIAIPEEEWHLEDHLEAGVRIFDILNAWDETIVQLLNEGNAKKLVRTHNESLTRALPLPPAPVAKEESP